MLQSSCQASRGCAAQNVEYFRSPFLPNRRHVVSKAGTSLHIITGTIVAVASMQDIHHGLAVGASGCKVRVPCINGWVELVRRNTRTLFANDQDYPTKRTNPVEPSTIGVVWFHLISRSCHPSKQVLLRLRILVSQGQFAPIHVRACGNSSKGTDGLLLLLSVRFFSSSRKDKLHTSVIKFSIG